MRSKSVVLCGMICVLMTAGYVSAQRYDYVLSSGVPFMPPNEPWYSVGWPGDDSIAVCYFRLPPVLVPGATQTVVVKTKFWTNHIPVIYCNYFGDWNPDVELAQGSLYGGIPSPNEEFIDSFAFQVPIAPGWYRMRFFARYDYDPMTSFYGKQDTVAVWTEMVFHVGYPLGIADPGSPRPAGSSRAVNMPNPFRRTTSLSFTLVKEAQATVRVYDGAGRLAKEVARGRLPAGEHVRIWDGSDSSGRSVSSGTYIFKVEAGSETLVSRVIRVE
jgi:hypothetical protein